MKRRIILLAGKTAVISLPKSWVQKQKLYKGDELELTEEDDTLRISATTKPKEKTTTLTIAGLHERTVRWLLSGLHKAGYDEIILFYQGKEQLDIIDDLVKNLFLGFVIMQQTPQRCVLKSLSTEVPQEYKNTLRRAFLVSLSFADATYEALFTSDNDALRQALVLEKTNNQLTNFCERIITTIHTSPFKVYEYVIVWNLEKIVDEFKYICSHFSRLGSFTLQPPLLQLCQQIIQLLRGYYELYYQFSFESLNTLAKTHETLKQQFITINPLQSYESLLLSHLHHILIQLADFSTSMFVRAHQAQ